MNFHIQNPSIPFPNMRPLSEVGAPPTTCRWPMWNDQERATHVYCGAATAKARPYCPDHCCLAFYPSGGGRFRPEDFGGKPAQQPRVEKVNRPKPVVVAVAPKAKPARKVTPRGLTTYIRTLPEIDIRLCANDREREIVNRFNGGQSHRAIAAAEALRLGKKVSNNVIAGTLSRIRKRGVED